MSGSTYPDQWVYDPQLDAVHEWGCTVYYDGHRAYQLHLGQKIGATSYGAFGADWFNSRRNSERWLERAKEAYAALCPH